MRILHTADWHLGKKTDDLDRLDEQKQALDQIIKIAKDKKVDMVIVAGDIYNSFVPSADAENLFYRTVSELSNNGNTAVVVIAGNHDDPKRMSNAGLFTSKFNIFLVGDINDIKIIKNANRDKNIYATSCGTGYIKFKTKAGEDVVVACLPYPSYYRYGDTKNENDKFDDKIRKWLAPAVKEFKPESVNILTAHLLTYGIDLGGEEIDEYGSVASTIDFVDRNVLDLGADYVALGHIHKLIKVDKNKNIYYSGSLINNFFADVNNDKFVIVADVDNTGVKNLEPVQLDVKRMVTFTSDSLEEIEKFCDVAKDDYIKATLKQNGSITFEQLKELRARHPNLITFSVLNEELLLGENIESKKDLTTSEIFDKFALAVTGKEAKPEVKELFLELMGEDLYEAN